MAGVSSELHDAGRVEVSVELPALCSPLFREKQRAVSQMAFLSNTLTEIFNLPTVFDPLQLNCTGETSWVLHVHIVCLNFDGNAFDLCLLAAVAALEDTKLPALVKEPHSERLAVASDAMDLVSEARSLMLSARPLPVTFARMPGAAIVSVRQYD